MSRLVRLLGAAVPNLRAAAFSTFRRALGVLARNASGFSFDLSAATLPLRSRGGGFPGHEMGGGQHRSQGAPLRDWTMWPSL